MRVRIKKLTGSAVVPKKAHVSDAGLDLVATSQSFDEYGNIVYGTGLAFEIPFGYVGLVFPRSSLCKKDLAMTNSVGVIDSGYRGEVTLKFKPAANFSATTKYALYEIGERIGQIIIIPYPDIEFELSDELSESDRGVTGYGDSRK